MRHCTFSGGKVEASMLDAAFKALGQMFSRPFRSVLWKSIGLALILIVVIGIGLHRVLVWLVTVGQNWAEQTIGFTTNMPVAALVWILSFATGLGIIAGSVFLMPAVTALVASFFVDDIAAEVEHTYYAADPPGSELPLWRALIEGIKTALLAVAVYLVALPFLLFAGFGAVIFFIATAFLLGREYFVLAAMRFRPPAEAKRLRREHQGTVFIAGLFIAAFVSIPILNLATPLFGMAFMVHMHKRLVGSRPSLIEHAPTQERS
jgi:CysZ protein